MSDLWQFIQGLGALVGLLTGLFILYERLFREAPLAVIIPKSLTPGSVTKVCRLRIINRSPRPILISWTAGDYACNFAISKDDSLREVISAVVPGEVVHVVNGQTTTDLTLFPPSRLNEIDLDNVIEADVRWIFAQPLVWKLPRKLPIKITKRAYLALVGNEVR